MVELWSDQPLSETPTLNVAYGGDVLNSLVTASRLGAQVGLVTRVGTDPFGPGLLRAWQAEGIDVRSAPLVPGENGVYFISVQADGEREFTYRRTGSAASAMRPEDLNPTYLESARIVLLSGITQAISDTAEATTMEAARVARAAGVQVAYDPNYRANLWAKRGGLAAAQRAAQSLLPLVDILLPSHPADHGLVNASPGEDTLERYLNCAPLVAVKRGEEGVTLAEGECVTHVPAVPAAHVRDTTGAGDAWNGAFLYALTQQRGLLEAARLANSVASQTLAYRGAIPPRSP